MVLGRWIATCRVKLCCFSYTKSSSQKVDINIIAKTVELIGKTQINFHDLTRQSPLGYAPKSVSNERKNKVDVTRIKSICLSNDGIKKVKRQPTKQKKNELHLNKTV